MLHSHIIWSDKISIFRIHLYLEIWIKKTFRFVTRVPFSINTYSSYDTLVSDDTYGCSCASFATIYTDRYMWYGPKTTFFPIIAYMTRVHFCAKKSHIILWWWYASPKKRNVCGIIRLKNDISFGTYCPTYIYIYIYWYTVLIGIRYSYLLLIYILIYIWKNIFGTKSINYIDTSGHNRKTSPLSCPSATNMYNNKLYIMCR